MATSFQQQLLELQPKQLVQSVKKERKGRAEQVKVCLRFENRQRFFGDLGTLPR